MEYLDKVWSLLSLTIPTFSFSAIAPNALFLNIMGVYGSSNCVGDEDNTNECRRGLRDWRCGLKKPMTDDADDDDGIENDCNSR